MKSLVFATHPVRVCCERSTGSERHDAMCCVLHAHGCPAPLCAACDALVRHIMLQRAQGFAWGPMFGFAPVVEA